MNKWNDPKLAVSGAIIGLFAYAYLHAPDDETMRGALILAFATAYGFWLGKNTGDDEKSANTGKAFDAIKAAAESTPSFDPNAIKAGDSVTLEKKDDEPSSDKSAH